MPIPYDQKKKKVIPSALKMFRLKSHCDCCVFGDLASEVGWPKKNLIEKLEEKRKVRSKAIDEKKLKMN